METISQVVVIVANIATSLTLIITIASYIHTQKRTKKESTLQAYRELQKNVLSQINEYPPSELREIARNPRSQEYKRVGEMLAQIEHFCVGINQGIYDLKTFYALAHGYFDDDRGILKPRLLPILEVKLVDAKEDYYSNIHKVWKKMKIIENKQEKRRK